MEYIDCVISKISIHSFIHSFIYFCTGGTPGCPFLPNFFASSWELLVPTPTQPPTVATWGAASPPPPP